MVELGGNDCDYNWKEISENPDKEYYPNTPLPKFIESINTIIEKFRANGIEPILTNLPPLSSQNTSIGLAKTG